MRILWQKIIDSFHQGWFWLTKRRRRRELPPPPFSPVYVDDVPDEVARDTVYLVGVSAQPWLAVLRCPCGCDETLLLNLLPEERPCWHAKVETTGSVTLHPSVWRTVGCHSHFILRSGKNNMV